MKKVLLLILLFVSFSVSAKQIGKNAGITYIDMDSGFVEYVRGLGYSELYGCFTKKDADGKIVRIGALCTSNAPGTSIYHFNTTQLLSNFGISPLHSETLLVVLAGKRSGDADYTLYQPMIDYDFSQGTGSGFTVNNSLNFVNFWYSGAFPK
jgi:hypothetical protein